MTDAEKERARLGVRPLPPKVGHMVTVYAKDGSAVECFPVDAREMLRSGEYSDTAPVPPEPAAVAPAPEPAPDKPASKSKAK